MIENLNTWTEHYLKFILEDSDRGFLILNKKMRIIYLNQFLISKLGYPREILVKKRISDFLKDSNKFKRDLLTRIRYYPKTPIKCRLICNDNSIMKLPFNIKLRINNNNILRGYYFLQDKLRKHRIF